MKILSLKLTHDGALAFIDNGKLIFSYEMEKINNWDRLSKFELDYEAIRGIMLDREYSLDVVDKIVIDGWQVLEEDKDEHSGLFDVEIVPGIKSDIKLMKYGHFFTNPKDILKSADFKIDALNLNYSSYTHASGHLFGAYCTSPFSQQKEDSFVLVWDGGTPPHLFYYKYEEDEVLYLGYLFPFHAGLYCGFAHEYAPFNEYPKHHYSVPGKYMAYTALGNVDEEILNIMNSTYSELMSEVNTEELVHYTDLSKVTYGFIERVKNNLAKKNFADADILSSFHIFIDRLLVSSLKEKVKQYPKYAKNLCYAGGSALSIKWNTSIRNSGVFDNIWIPPFPNDSGSAIGAACCAMMTNTKKRALDWNVYQGPRIRARPEELNLENYDKTSCFLPQLAQLLHETGEPVVFLNHRAALGPRALGNRSILAPAVSPKMKALLNELKGREEYRPVAPICLEEDAPTIFSPGTPDPYMLFEHMVKEEWKDKVPAIVHIDGSARLQTVNTDQNALVYHLLKEYKNISGVPVLCNTSANFSGKGFFPNVQSALDWGKTKYVWCNETLYTKKAIKES